VALLLSACAGSSPTDFQKSRAAAERAYAAGRYREAAQHWEQAAAQAQKRSTASKARQRQASCLLRAGDTAQARTVLQSLAREHSALSPRAEFDLAVLDLETGQPDQGSERLKKLIETQPESAIAQTALRHYLRLQDERAGAEGSLIECERLLQKLSRSGLDEQLRYQRARLLQKLGRKELALTAYLELAGRHPYPLGAFWDDALWQAAQLQSELGNAASAIETLRRMLKSRETSDFVGSYERPRYGEAHFHLAVLLRDGVKEPAAAAREFERVYQQHPTSRLRDDALWEAAKLYRALGDGQHACSLMTTLREEQPESRYLSCTPLLCETAQVAAGSRPCPNYIVKTLN
jgi:tetratricopeptide (TPR) repeat protein